MSSNGGCRYPRERLHSIATVSLTSWRRPSSGAGEAAMTASRQVERSADSVLRVPHLRDDALTSDQAPGRPRPAVALQSIASVEVLKRRPCRPADPAAENRVLVDLL